MQRQVFSAALLAASVSPEPLATEEAARLPEIVTEAIVETERETDEGQIIHAVLAPWRKLVEYAAEDADSLYQLGDRKLEEILAAAYELAGFHIVTLTPRARDHGRDVIAVKLDDFGTVRFVIEAKAWKPNTVLPYDKIRAFGFVVLGDPKANKGVIATTADFPPEVYKDPILAPHLDKKIELINGTQLVRRLSDLAQRISQGGGK